MRMKFTTYSPLGCLFVAALVCVAGFILKTHAQTVADKPAATASISGRVTLDGKPVPNVFVIVREPWHDNLFGRSIAKTRTDADGRFSLGNLPPGSFLVTPQAPAYRVSGNNERSLGGERGVSVTLMPGEARTGFDFTLERGGVITGRILDQAGGPVIAQTVYARRLIGGVRNNPNTKTDTRMFGDHAEAVTDDRGRYRFFALRPGQYLINTGDIYDDRVDLMFGRLIKNSLHRNTYYAQATSSLDASLVEVTPGGETSNLDIRLSSSVIVRSFQISGRVINSSNDIPTHKIWVSVAGGGEKDSDGLTFGRIHFSSPVDARGEFTLSGLPQGRYRISADPEPAEREFFSRTLVTVADRNVSDVVLRSQPGLALTGRLAITNSTGRPLPFRLDELELAITTKDEAKRESTYRRTRVNADGSFSATGLRPGAAEIELYSRHRELKLTDLVQAGIKVGRFVETRITSSNGRLVDFCLDVDHSTEALLLTATYSDGPSRPVGPPANQRLSSVRPGLVQGEVKGNLGSWPNGVVIAVAYKRIGSDDRWTDAAVDASGSFRVMGLSAGEYAFLATVALPGLPPSAPPLRAYSTVVVKDDLTARVVLMTR